MEDQNQLIYRRIGHVKNREGNTMTRWLARWRPKKTPPLTPSGPPLHFSPQWSPLWPPLQPAHLKHSAWLNICGRHSQPEATAFDSTPHQTDHLGANGFPTYCRKAFFALWFSAFLKYNDLCRHLLKLFLLVALLALQVPLQYRISGEGDALVLRDPKCELVLSWTAPLC